VEHWQRRDARYCSAVQSKGLKSMQHRPQRLETASQMCRPLPSFEQYRCSRQGLRCVSQASTSTSTETLFIRLADYAKSGGENTSEGKVDRFWIFADRKRSCVGRHERWSILFLFCAMAGVGSRVGLGTYECGVFLLCVGIMWSRDYLDSWADQSIHASLHHGREVS
jgi:hypothetical protein